MAARLPYLDREQVPPDVQAVFDGIAGDGFEVHAPAAAAAGAGVAHVLDESRQGSDRVGFLHGAHGDLSGPVRARGAEPRPAAAGAS
jgi:hypothetical protein